MSHDEIPRSLTGLSEQELRAVINRSYRYIEERRKQREREAQRVSGLPPHSVVSPLEGS